MTITDIAKEEAEKYEKKLYGEDCTVKSSVGKKEIYHTDVFYAFEVAYMLGYNRGRAEEMSKGDYE